MSKAEEFALEKYPQKIEWVGNQWDGYPWDLNKESRAACKQGYEQAEKDNELTWEDVALINSVVTEMLNECGDNVLYDTEEKFCREVLKRFNKERKEK